MTRAACRATSSCSSPPLFDIKQTNIVSTTPSVSPVFGTQSGEVEVYGGELEFVARIRNQLSFNGSYSYNHSKVLRSNVAAEVGAPLPVTPKHKASLFVDYTFQKGAIGGLGFGFGARYTSGSAGSLPGPFNPVVYYGQAATLSAAARPFRIGPWLRATIDCGPRPSPRSRSPGRSRASAGRPSGKGAGRSNSVRLSGDIRTTIGS